MRVLYLANRIPWFGAHTGYELLPHFLPETGISSRTISPGEGWAGRALGKAVSLFRRHGRVSQSDASARARFEWNLARHPDIVGHLLYGEEHLPFWGDATSAARRRCVLTLHQPFARLGRAKTESLSACPHLIVLWQRDLQQFREQARGGTVDFIPHGADIDFFSPSPEPAKQRLIRLLYVGVHLRNIAMLVRVIEALCRSRDDVHFDLLVPAHRRADPAWAALQDHPKVTWHAGVNDEQLRELYRNAWLLFLPMNDSGANTAVVESLACGLPIVTTDVGGIRDYGGGTVFPVVENDDDEGMLALIGKYLAQPEWREEVARNCRAFACEELAWPLIAQRHADVYRRIASA